MLLHRWTQQMFLGNVQLPIYHVPIQMGDFPSSHVGLPCGWAPVWSAISVEKSAFLQPLTMLRLATAFLLTLGQAGAIWRKFWQKWKSSVEFLVYPRYPRLSVSYLSYCWSVHILILLISRFVWNWTLKFGLSLILFCSWTKWTRHVYRTCMGVYHGHVNGGEYNIIMYNNDIPQF